MITTRRHRTVVRTALALGCSTAALLLGSPAFAQNTVPADQPATTADAAEDTGNAEIIVTAQFREQRLQDTPIAITAVNAEMLEARSQTNLTQVADQAPNVQIKPQGASFGPSISASIRGIGQADFNPAYEPGVGIYIDDVYYPQLTGAVFDLLDLDRVEILRGPQGTLAGRNSIGGAIKMYSKKPTGETGGYVEAQYGIRQRLGLRASADFKLTDTLFGRLSGVFKRQDGYVDRIDYGCANPGGGIAAVRPAGKCKISELGGVGYQAVRGILRYAPNDDFEITVSGDYTHDEHTIAGEVLLEAGLASPNINPAPGVPYDRRFVCGRFCNYMTTGQPAGVWVPPIPVDPFGAAGTPLAQTSGSDRSVYDGWGFAGNIHYQLNDMLALDSITGYREFQAKFDSDDDLSPANIGFGQNDLSNWNFSQELRLGAKIGDAINLTVGGYYFKQSTTYDSYQDIRYVPVYPLQFVQPDVIKADAKAVFGHANWEIVEGLNLSGGVRYTKESKDYNYYRLNPNGTINGFLDPIGAAYGLGYSGPDTRDTDRDGNTTETVNALSGARATYSKGRVDWRASVDYRVSPALLVYGTISTGFKGGGTNPRPFNAGQVRTFDPETLVAYELGFKSDFLDRRLRVNVSAFINDYKDIQLPILACPDSPCALPVNGGNGKYKGVEVELLARPTDGLSIDASLSYLHFKYDSIQTGVGGPSNPAGPQIDDPSTAPEWKWSAGIQYEIPLGNAGSLTPRLDAAYQDDLYTGPTTVAGNRVRTFIPSYTLANARLTWRNAPSDLDVSFEVTNLFDKYYFYNVFDLRGAGAGFKKGQPGRPREWAITVKKKF